MYRTDGLNVNVRNPKKIFEGWKDNLNYVYGVVEI